MEENVIKVKQEWEKIHLRHVNKLPEIQKIIEDLSEIGLTVATGDLHDLMNSGIALYEQARQKAKSNASIFSLPAARAKFITENTEILSQAILTAKTELTRILATQSQNPLDVMAYAITKGQISVSNDWSEALKESFTIRESSSRKQALKLMQNVKSAIQELNDFVKDNKNIGIGLTTFQDNRRSLVWIGGSGEVNLDTDSLEFV